MTKDVLVTVEWLQLDDEEASVASKAVGTYYSRNGKHYILYEENMDGQEGTTKNTIKIAEDHITITRKGAVNACMVFDMSGSSKTAYQTPYGTLHFQINTEQMQVEVEEESINIGLYYTLTANEELISDNRIAIRVCAIR